MAARWIGVVAVVVVVTLGGAADAQEILGNDAVVTMVKAGLSESLILTKIQATTTKFDLLAETLIGLKAAGVPERIIEAMLTLNGRSTSIPAPAPATAPPMDDRPRR